MISALHVGLCRVMVLNVCVIVFDVMVSCLPMGFKACHCLGCLRPHPVHGVPCRGYSPFPLVSVYVTALGIFMHVNWCQRSTFHAWIWWIPTQRASNVEQCHVVISLCRCVPSLAPLIPDPWIKLNKVRTRSYQHGCGRCVFMTLVISVPYEHMISFTVCKGDHYHISSRKHCIFSSINIRESTPRISYIRFV